MPKSAKQLTARIRAIWDTADTEGRDLTFSEREEVEALLASAKSQKSIEDDIRKLDGELGRGLGSVIADGSGGSSCGPPGSRFIESAGYKSIADSGNRGQNWTSGAVDVGYLEAKGTLLSTPGTALTPAEYQPGIVETLFQRLTVADLLSSEPTNAAQVRYVREGTATNAADAVSEGSAKPESTLAFSEEVVPVRKIATFLPVSDEMLEDAPSVESYLNSRLGLFVQIKEEQQLLRGNGTAPQIQGIIGASGVNTITVSGTAGTAITENIFTVMNNTRGSSLLDPDAIIVHPTQYAAMRLSKDGQSQFFGGGPWLPPTAGASQFAAGSYWGVPVVVSTAVGAGTALVGSFREAARIYRRGGLTVEASNAHSDYFQKNLVALRAEERLALAIYRPSAFTTITFS
jgi:HK97 family phage major capsid protein